jgi:site-specific recombinase XerD
VLLVSNGGGARPVETLLPEGCSEKQRAAALRRAESELASGSWWVPTAWDGEDGMIERFVASRVERGCKPKTCAGYRQHLTAARKMFADRNPSELTRDDGLAYVKARTKLVRPATVRQELAAMRVLQGWCVEMGWASKVAWAGVTSPKVTDRLKRAATTTEIGQLIRAAERLAKEPPAGSHADWSWWPAAMALMLHGLRASEVLARRAGDVEFHTGPEGDVAVVLVRTSKSSAGVRAVPVTSAWAVQVLHDVVDGLKPSDPLFCAGAEETRGVARAHRTPFATVAVLRNRLRMTCVEGGVDPEGLCAHALRHTAVTQALASGGVATHSVMRMAGHSRASVTEGYVHATMTHALPASTAVGRVLDAARMGRTVLRGV